MEEEKPCALISEVGGEFGYLEEVADILKQHFRLIPLAELLRDPELHGPKIQVHFIWKYLPAAEPRLLRLLPGLRVVASGGVGVDHLDLPSIGRRGVKVSNTPGVVSDATADLAFGLLLASARKILQGHQIAVDPNTVRLPQSLMGSEVTGATLGIIGLGHIGFKIAQRSKGFDMKVLYHNRTRRSADVEQAVAAWYCQELAELLAAADYVVVAVRLTPDTTELISHSQLSIMKPTATLVNISRGEVVNQEALVEALRSGKIRAAALDVTHPEPLPRDHPLLQLPNVLITPHIGINTNHTARKVAEKMVENALAALRGLPLPNEVKLQ